LFYLLEFPTTNTNVNALTSSHTNSLWFGTSS